MPDLRCVVKISELIAALEKAKTEHGDHTVYARTGCVDDELEVDFVEFHSGDDRDCNENTGPHVYLTS